MKSRLKGNNHVYLISHIPSGLNYIGMHEKHANIRFEEHMLGFGSEYIWDLICAGSTRNDFKMEILSAHNSVKEALAAESDMIQKYETAYPFGMNIERNTSGWKKFNTMRDEFISKGFCIKILDHLIVNGWKLPPPSALQSKIELLAKNQNAENPISEHDMILLRRRFALSYALKEKIFTDGDKFKEGRKKLKERLQRGELTEAEVIAQRSRSKTTSKVWQHRTKEQRTNILAAATKAAAIANRKEKSHDRFAN